MELESALRRGAEALRDCDAMLITAGAGMGVDSGLPDFRGDKGFWKAYPVAERLGLSFVEMANPDWFPRNPPLAWAFYGHRLNLYRQVRPHAGFTALLDIARRKPGGYFVFTSNVDGHFQKAGYPEERIEECHGSIHWFQCTGPCGDRIWDASSTTVTLDEERFAALPPLPRCPDCGKTARPNILMFGDWSWDSRRTDAQAERLAGWLRDVARRRLRVTIVEIGAGQAVATVRYRSEQTARSLGATLIRINPRDYRVPEGHIAIPCGALEGITGMAAHLP